MKFKNRYYLSTERRWKSTMSKDYKLYIASVSMPIEVQPRIYAVIADEIVKDEVIAIAVREQYHLCDGDILNPKVKKVHL